MKMPKVSIDFQTVLLLLLTAAFLINSMATNNPYLGSRMLRCGGPVCQKQGKRVATVTSWNWLRLAVQNETLEA